MTGTLIIVATPIGNLDDTSPRLRQALARADLIACEDTRRTGRLLAHLGLKRPLISVHDHNERQRLPRVLQALDEDRVVALVSDAGTPLICDPGFLVLREAAARGIPLEVVPGPSAVLAALVLSALPPYPFTFCGFPPPRTGRRRTFYRRFRDLDHTLLFFESPHRLVASLRDAVTELGDRPAAICRELTKLHEEVLRGSLCQLLDELNRRSSFKGEFVLVVGGSGSALG